MKMLRTLAVVVVAAVCLLLVRPMTEIRAAAALHDSPAPKAKNDSHAMDGNAGSGPYLGEEAIGKEVIGKEAISDETISKETMSKETWSHDVAPLLYAHCTTCHHQGGAGPFSLLTYEDAKRWAPQILNVTQSRFMPPWLPEPGYGDFADVRRLSDADQALLKRWITGGIPVGDLKAAPPEPHYDATWQMGKPDLVLKVAKPFTLEAGGTDVFRNLILPYPLKQTHYVRAMEIRPGGRRWCIMPMCWWTARKGCGSSIRTIGRAEFPAWNCMWMRETSSTRTAISCFGSRTRRCLWSRRGCRGGLTRATT